MSEEYPSVITPFDIDPLHSSNPFYVSAINQIMSHVLPPHFFEEEDALLRFHKMLPIFSWTPMGEPPFDLSFFLCCRFRPNVFRFFYEMVSRWLIPGKRMNALLQFAVDFGIPELGEQMYVGGEVKVRIESRHELAIMEQNLPIIESEIRLGVESAYQANRILEIKGLSADEKTAMIQENITLLVKKRPQDFDYDVLSEMQHFLVLCKNEFKAAREYKQMSRIICVHYLFRKALRICLEAFPERRYISAKIIHARLNGKEKVVGIVLGMSYLGENEIFDERHILGGVQTLIPDARVVEGSFFANDSRSESTRMYYLEITKKADIPLSLQETKLLKQELSGVLKSCVEQRLNPIFMPPNEEEIMRDILTLSNQLKFVRDLPHVMISFNQQTGEALEFLVVVLRVVRLHCRTLAEFFEDKPSYLEIIFDRTKNVGTLRKKYNKEASVFKVRIRKAPFLRQDRSVDLYKARQGISQELTRVMGEYRDYNGGTISKEAELMTDLCRLLGPKAKENSFLLENFFYSLSPATMRSILEPEPLRKLFHMLLDIEQDELAKDQPCHYQIQEDSNYFYMLVTSADSSFREPVKKAIDDLKISSFQLATCYVLNNDLSCFGVISRTSDLAESIRLRLAVEKAMTEWTDQKYSALNY
ncbi:MAG: hypothetical protein KR126chlam2_00040 [Chlamydiae bacterium]|nr:hypothetical protein [Chlamydiota bacterium]